MRSVRLSVLRGILGLRAESAPAMARVTPQASVTKPASNSGLMGDLKAQITKRNAIDRDRIRDLKKSFGHVKLSNATIEAAYSGMRGVTALVYEPSLLDPINGIRYRDKSIFECQETMPRAPGGEEPLPEAVFWLLLTGSIPSETEVSALTTEIHSRFDPVMVDKVAKVLNAMPSNTHPMTSYVVGIMTLQTNSKFAAAYAQGMSKKQYWEYALEDTMDLMTHSPVVAAMVYNQLKQGKAWLASEYNPTLDWAANFTNMMGFSDAKFWDCMRLYLTIHADHEGGNVSAHTTTLVGSALSDPYRSFAAGLNGLAGPLHGLANQEVLTYLKEQLVLLKRDNVDMNDEAAMTAAMEKYTWERLNSGRVIPGYGHAVLRRTDPRYVCQRNFCLRNCRDSELFRLVNIIYNFMPTLLTKHGKTKNPYPNVDAHSCVLLQHYGMTEESFYTVLFGVSRQLGVCSGLILDRIQGRSIERPKSTTTEQLAREHLVTAL